MTLNAYDDLAICNISQNLIGQRPINSISSPTTDSEATYARLYPITVSSLLTRHDWNFANPVTQLASSNTETPQGGYLYAYKLPSAAIAGPFGVYTAADLDRPISDYINANDHIHTSETSCYVRYRNVPPVEEWPVYFVDLVATALASRTAKMIARDSDMATELRIQAFGSAQENGEGGLFKSSKTIDAMSRPVKTIHRQGNPLTGLVY